MPIGEIPVQKAKFPDQNFGEDYVFIKSVLAGGGRLHRFPTRPASACTFLHQNNTSWCYPQYRLPPFMMKRLLPKWAAEMLSG